MLQQEWALLVIPGDSPQRLAQGKRAATMLLL
ncbi:MAG: hypothetical protein JWP36_2461 [Paucimonas sp.]|nr:hypothetical protein [Paucimonas sp.]